MRADDAKGVAMEGQGEFAAAPVEEAHPIDARGIREGLGQATPATAIRLGRPLSIRIRSIFPGEDLRRGRSVLVTSAARSPVASDAAPYAMHYYFRDAEPGRTLLPRADEPGSDVMYYSPGLTENTVQVTVRLSYDRFDEEQYRHWAEAAQKAALLPVFALSPQGLAAGALVYAIPSAVKIVLRAVDRRFDGDNDWFSTWKLPVEEAGYESAHSGYWLFYGDDEEGVPTVPGPDSPLYKAEFRARDEAYMVDTRTGTLRYAGKPERQVLTGPPYVLAYVNGATSDELEAWTRTAVSAALADRFLQVQGDDASDVVELLEVYNDIIMSRRVQQIDRNLADKDLGGQEKAQLEAKRKGLLKNILDKDIVKQLHID